MAQSCKTCQYLAVTPDKRGRIVVRDSAYKCLCPIPELPPLPSSITKSYAWRGLPEPSWVSAKQGTDCPCYKERAK